MPDPLEPHPFAALFPELPPEELTQLARDIKERGLLEPIILHKGLILDGRNRYRACQIAGVKPRIEEFDAKAAKRSPEDRILAVQPRPHWPPASTVWRVGPTSVAANRYWPAVRHKKRLPLFRGKRSPIKCS